MLRILYILHSLSPSGEFHQAWTLSKYLKSKNTEIHFCILSGVQKKLAQKFRSENIFLHECTFRSFLDPFFYLRLRKLITTIQPDVIHGWENPSLTFCQGVNKIKSCARNAKIIITIRRQDPFHDWTISVPYSRLCSGVNVWVTNNSVTRDYYQTQGIHGDWRVVHDGVCMSEFSSLSAEKIQEKRNSLLTELKLPETAKFVGCIGPIRPEKRWKWAVWSVDSIIRIYPEFHLLFLGNDADIRQKTLLASDGDNGTLFPQRGRLETFARQYERRNIIHFLGNRPDIPEILPCLNLLWVPQSIFGSSVSTIQGMLAGTPIIATKTPGIHEILPEETASFASVNKETLQLASLSSRLLENNDLAQKQAQSAQVYAREKLHAKNMVDAYWKIYTE
ncbi:MAG: glycosyltransferase [Planctomycetia bacterium]|nr:glycosyltransferase [Planctomycetia bacterium]